jgi:hypothetical protein
MQDMRGKVKKRLVLLHAESGSIYENADLSTPTGEVVGRVTSFAGEMGIAMVHAPYFETGTILHAPNFSARVTPLLV